MKYGHNELVINNGKAHVPCIVVARHHSVVWEKVGHLQTLGMSVVLEAKDGEWEDLLTWITTGAAPDWAVTDDSR